MKKITVLLAILFTFLSCTEEDVLALLSQDEIGNGLREALDNGVSHQVTKLTAEDGFYKNELVKIMLPEEVQVVEKQLRLVGGDALADKGLLLLNRAAEDAVKTATPIFVDAVKEITFEDAKNILMGDDNSATTYLQEKTKQKLYNSFNPVVKKSFSKVGADKIWKEAISSYNAIPIVEKINPDLTDHVTKKALQGVFKMIAIEEKGIRKDKGMRSTDLLKRVFALQDDK